MPSESHEPLSDVEYCACLKNYLREHFNISQLLLLPLIEVMMIWTAGGRGQVAYETKVGDITVMTKVGGGITGIMQVCSSTLQSMHNIKVK